MEDIREQFSKSTRTYLESQRAQGWPHIVPYLNDDVRQLLGAYEANDWFARIGQPEEPDIRGTLVKSYSQVHRHTTMEMIRQWSNGLNNARCYFVDEVRAVEPESPTERNRVTAYTAEYFMEHGIWKKIRNSFAERVDPEIPSWLWSMISPTVGYQFFESRILLSPRYFTQIQELFLRGRLPLRDEVDPITGNVFIHYL